MKKKNGKVDNDNTTAEKEEESVYI